MAASAGNGSVWRMVLDKPGTQPGPSGGKGAPREGPGAAGRRQDEHERAMHPCGKGGQQHLGCAPKSAASDSRALLEENIPRCSLSPGETRRGQCGGLRTLLEQERHGCTGPGEQLRVFKLITGLEPVHVRRN